MELALLTAPEMSARPPDSLFLLCWPQNPCVLGLVHVAVRELCLVLRASLSERHVQGESAAVEGRLASPPSGASLGPILLSALAAVSTEDLPWMTQPVMGKYSGLVY